VFALVDCNSFYASCEQVFRPDLRGRPVVVLSNNDGCIVAANRQAKALNIPSFSPYFKVKGILSHHRVAVFSSNYELYGDLSQRVMDTLREFSPEMEIYSIDEAFIELEGMSGDLVDYGRQMRRRVWRDVRIPVSVGIAPTKTLAKIANHLAKKHRHLRGCAAIYNDSDRALALKQFPVDGVWGIGRRLSARLNALGVKTAWNLSQQQPRLLRKQFGVTMERTIRELNGEPCFKLDEQPPPKQQIFSTKSFGERIYELSELQEAVSCFASVAMEKLRGQSSLVSTALVFIQTSRFDENHYSRSQTVKLSHPTNDTRHLVQRLRTAVADIFKAGLPYSKAGVGLIEIISAEHQQLSLLNDQQSFKSQTLMDAVDAINQKMPQGIFLASNGTKQAWAMQRQRLSPAYTTRWEDLPVVK